MNQVLDIVGRVVCLPSLAYQSEAVGSWLDLCTPANTLNMMTAFISILTTAFQTFGCPGLTLFHSVTLLWDCLLVSRTARSLVALIVGMTHKLKASSGESQLVALVVLV